MGIGPAMVQWLRSVDAPRGGDGAGMDNGRVTIKLSATVNLERRESIALVWCDNPPVNAISGSVRAGLFEAMRLIAGDESVAAAIILCRGKTFFVGADVTEFGQASHHPTWSETDAAIDHSPKPVIAAMHGNCLGGGLEYALACHYRIAERGTRFGFPEVKLGLIPGGGGTQRFPRLAGFEAALSIIPTGREFNAEEALSLGIVDRLVEGDLVAAALAFTREEVLTRRTGTLPRAAERTGRIQEALTRPDLFPPAREAVAKRYRGRMSPLLAIDAIEKALHVPFAEGMAAEAALFERCRLSAEHRGLAHLFFAEREARRIPGFSPDTPVRAVEKVAIVGGGTMGRGIALACSEAGIPVRVIEASDAAARAMLDQAGRELDRRVTAGRLSREQAAERLGRIGTARDLEAAADADLVIEAVHEDMALKRHIFAALDKIVRQGAILASNTSNLDLNHIAAATARPHDVVGLHFFSPANVMKLLEIVRGDSTSKETLATALALARRLDKIAVVAGVCDGFIVNRIFGEYWRQTRFLVEEGASPYEVDRVLRDFGMAMGPFAVSDLVGLDVSQRIRQNRRATAPAVGRPDGLGDTLAEAGRLGRKTGLGWYRYQPGSPSGAPDPDVLAMIGDYRREQGFACRAIPDEEIVERCIYGVINEGARVLEERIALRASDIDVAAVLGYGFPGHRGGPMRYAEEIGLQRVAAVIERLQASQGRAWQPSRLLLSLGKSGRPFSAIEALAESVPVQ